MTINRPLAMEFQINEFKHLADRLTKNKKNSINELLNKGFRVFHHNHLFGKENITVYENISKLDITIDEEGKTWAGGFSIKFDPIKKSQ